MPFEVSEIAISMRVTSDADADAGRPAGDRPLDDDARKSLIDECVERVLQVLRAERER